MMKNNNNNLITFEWSGASFEKEYYKSNENGEREKISSKEWVRVYANTTPKDRTNEDFKMYSGKFSITKEKYNAIKCQ
jgi:hypothetical protein